MFINWHLIKICMALEDIICALFQFYVLFLNHDCEQNSMEVKVINFSMAVRSL